MEAIREIARAYYERASEEEKDLAKGYLKKLDVNGDGKISLLNFEKYVEFPLKSKEVFFKQLDANGDGTLDFDEVLILYYMVKKMGLHNCHGCGDLLVGPYFSCLLCLGKSSTYDLCCACHRGGKFVHHHPSNNLLDQHALLKLFTESTAADSQKTQRKREMEELHQIAMANYQESPPEIQVLASEFFKSMDTNEDGKIDLPEFLAFMKLKGHSQMHNPLFFKELDIDNNGTLDFNEVITLYYLIESGRPFCDCCGNFIPGIFFSCVQCLKESKSSINLCLDCYRSKKCEHNHNGRAQFLDNYVRLLKSNTNSTLSKATGVNDHPKPSTTRAEPGTSSLDSLLCPDSPPHVNISLPTPTPAPAPAPTPILDSSYILNNLDIALKILEGLISFGTALMTLIRILRPLFPT